MTEPAILTETRGPVWVITLNRPHVRNAFDRRQSQEMADAIDRLDDDDALRVGVITGAGDTFCAGTDLKAYAAGERTRVGTRGTYGVIEDPPRKPLVAAVEGYAVGGGCELALTCDLIVAAETATFGLPEVRRGLLAGAGGVVRLPRQIPYHHAMELALTGAMIDCERADRLGLVNRRVPRAGARGGGRARRGDRAQPVRCRAGGEGGGAHERGADVRARRGPSSSSCWKRCCSPTTPARAWRRSPSTARRSGAIDDQPPGRRLTIIT